MGDAIRLLDQATFGPTDDLIEEAKQKGPALFIEEQFQKTASRYDGLPVVYLDIAHPCATNSSAQCGRDNFSAFYPAIRFFKNAVYGQDQLRQRVAFALSQIVVVSAARVQRAYGIETYQQILLDNAFSNFRDLMYQITLSPVMGEYLDMVNNAKGDPALGTQPNENYARELLQLFTIGEFKLNRDGSKQLSGLGRAVATYDQQVIKELARIFTGWTYPTRSSQTLRWFNPENYIGQMELVPAYHDTGMKTLLDGKTVAAGQSGAKDLDDALDIIFNHPNVGPFIGRQLIQHLVTSNPTSAYIGRVTDAFNDNGQGVRGDMKAVLRAVLLDSEARGALKTDVNYGRVREPVLFLTGVTRAIGVNTDGVWLQKWASGMAQFPFTAPSVFNFYPPDFQAPGMDIRGPQFKIYHTEPILNRPAAMHELFLSYQNPDQTVPGATGTRLKFDTIMALAADPPKLVDKLNTVLLNGRLSDQGREAVIQAVQAVPDYDPWKRAGFAGYLISTSPQYQVVR